MRWDNAKSGKSGYAPACHNEWQCRLCEKPRVKCSVCPNQAFIMRGTISTGAPFVMGFYPMLPDGTCYLLVADFDREDWRDALAYVKTCDFSRAPCALGVPVPGMGHMFGFSSKSQSRRRRRAASAPPSSQILWSGYLISGFVLTTGSFRARIRGRSAVSVTSLHCRVVLDRPPPLQGWRTTDDFRGH